MFAALKNLVSGAGQLAYDFDPEAQPQPLPSGSIWTLQAATSKLDKTPVSVFSLDKSTASEAQLGAARNATKRLKTLRHPIVLKFIESDETPSHLYVVTEQVESLQQALERDGNDAAIVWGIYQMAKAIEFLVSCKIVHGNVCLGSIFVTVAGEWKLGGLEFMASEQDPPDTPTVTLEVPSKYHPADRQTGKGRANKWSTDMWGFGCLLWEVYNGELPRAEKLKSMGSMPKTLIPHYVSLVSANPRTRPSPKQFLDKANQEGHYLKIDFVDTNLFLDEFAIKDDDDKARFFKRLPDMIATFPKAYTTHKILPQLLNAFQFAGAGASVLPPILRIGNLLSEEEYKDQIIPIVVKLFSSTDRLTRINLLQQLDQFVKYLSADVVTKEIFPHVASGFSDTVPALREQTLKAMLFLAPKLSRDVMDNQLLGHFAKLQRDEQPGIRTNTTICLGKLAPHLNAATRQKILAAAFLRATKDTFAQARLAGLNAMLATSRYYLAHDIATKILPSVSPLCVDPDKSVREQTFALIKALLEKLKRASNGEEEEVVEEETATLTSSSWVGWAGSAVSGISTKILASKKAEGGTPAKAATASASRPQGASRDSEADHTEDEEWQDAEEPEPAAQPPSSSKPKASTLRLGLKAKKSGLDKWEADGLDDDLGAGDGWGDDDDVDWNTDLNTAGSGPGSRTTSRQHSFGSSSGSAKGSSSSRRSSPPKAKQLAAAERDAAASWGGDGWGDDGDDPGAGWGDTADDLLDAPISRSSPTRPAAPRVDSGAGLSKAELAKQRREQRKAERLKLREARDAAAGSKAKPGGMKLGKPKGLGAVRKMARD